MKTGFDLAFPMQEAEGAPKPLVGDVSPAYHPKSKDTLSKGADKGSEKAGNDLSMGMNKGGDKGEWHLLPSAASVRILALTASMHT